MLFALACATGCPGDDVPAVDTTGEDSTGGDSTGPSTVTTPTTVTMTGGDSTSGGMDTETDGADSTSSGGGPVCGDGIVDEGEDCDGDDLGGADCMSRGFDGGDLGCNDDCTFDESMCTSNCGNGLVDEGEDCDGDDLAGAACTDLENPMSMEPWDRGMLGCADDCTFDTTACVMWECENGVIDPDEVCESMDLGGNDCTTVEWMAGTNYDGGTLACAANCMDFDTSGCFVCGDDAIGGMEVCDGTDLAGADCASQGFVGGTLGCAADCGGYDTSMCTTCGDDMVNGADVCDGTDLAGQDCVSQGFAGGTLACAADCGTFDTSGCFSCGDGNIDPGEVCDGANLGGEDCISQGFAGGTLACAADCGGYDTSMCTNPCGNGVVDPGEVCDGNDFGGLDCVSQGFLGGGLNCSNDCTAIITDACYDNVTTVCSTPLTPIGPGPADPIALDTIPVAGLVDPLTDVDVFVDISHTWTGDLDIDLTYVPGNETVRFMDSLCSGDDDILATFDDQAAASIDCALPPPVGQGGVVLPSNPLSAFYNWGGNGDWQIAITDNFNPDGGTLNEWCVNLGTNSLAPICGNGTVEGLETCEGNEIAYNTCEGFGFAGGVIDCGGNCNVSTAGCSNSVIAICNSPGSAISDVAPVNDTINIPVGSGNVADIDVHVDITHTWDADLDMTLTHDLTGTVVELSTDQCGSDDDVFAFYNDEGNGLADCVDPIGIEGNINPEGVLADFDGELAEGDWTLNIIDDAGGDNGTLNTWCVYITP